MEESDQDSVEIINITFIIHTYISYMYVYINMIESYQNKYSTSTYICAPREKQRVQETERRKKEKVIKE